MRASGVGPVTNSITQSTRSLGAWSSGLRSAGYALTATFTAPVIAAGKKVMDFTLANQEAFAELQKVYGSNPFGNYTAELESLRKLFRALSDEYGVNQAEVIQVGAAWAQAGVSGAALGRSVETTLKAMVIGGLSATDATNALIAIQAQYGASSHDLIKILNDLNVVENQTGISMQGLIDGFSRAAGSAANAGVDYRHLAAFLAALTPAAGSASQAGNALKTIISRLLAPTKDASDILGKLGINIADVGWKSSTGTQRIERMAIAFHGLDRAQQNVVSSTLASRFQINRFDILMNDVFNGITKGAKGLSYYGVALNSTRDETVNARIAQNELQTVLKSQPHILQQIGVIMKNDLADVMVNLLPMILAVADAIKNLAGWFSNLSPNVQKLIGLALLFLAALGPVLLYISAIGSGVRVLSVAFGLLFSPLTRLIGLFGALGGGAAGLVGKLNPFGRGGGGGLAAGLETEVAGAEAAMGQFETAMGAWTATITGFLGEISGLLAAILSEITAFFATASSEFAAGGAAVASETGAASAAAAAAWGTGMATMTAETAAVWASILEVTGTALPAQVTEVAAGMAAIEGTVAAAGEVIDMVWVESLGVWMSETEAAMLVIDTEIAAGMAEGAAEVAAGGGLIAGAFGALFDGLAWIAGAVFSVVTSPWTLAAAAVGVIIYALRDKLGGVWQDIVRTAQSAFNALPASVQNAFMAVVRIVENAVMAVYHLFSYLNPFAHHSPSLVENVTNGMAVVAAAFSSITQIRGPIMQAYADLQKFGQLAANFQNMLDQKAIAKDASDLAKAGAPASVVEMYVKLRNEVLQLTAREQVFTQAIREQQGVVDGLQASLDKLNTQLSAEQAVLDSLTKRQTAYNDQITAAKQKISALQSTQIVGEQAMSDAIFANAQAQKQLQLQMMHMEDAVGPISNVQAKLNSLASDITNLSQTQESLRKAGAGSDILKTYDDQLNAMRQQQSQLNGTSSAYNDLNKQLDALNRKGQELNLENSLQFDGLRRQIDAAANSMNELPFDQIMAGIQANNDVLKVAQVNYNGVTQQVKAQQAVVDGLTAQRNKLQLSYDAENKKLQQLQSAYQSINQTIQDINSSLTTMQSKASAAASAAKAGKEGTAAKNFDAAAGGNFDTGSLGSSLLTEGDQGGAAAIQALTDQAQKNTRDAFKKLDLFKPFKDMWHGFTDWWDNTVVRGIAHLGDKIHVGGLGGVSKQLDSITNSRFVKDLQDMANVLGRFGGYLAKAMAPEVEKFFKTLSSTISELGRSVLPRVMPLLDAVGRLLHLMWDISKPLVEIALVLLIQGFKTAADVTNQVLGPALTMVARILGDLMRVLTDALNFIVDVFTGQWSKAWQDVVDAFEGIFKTIGDFIQGVWNTIVAGVEAFVGKIVDFFKWLYDVLIGHSIIPELINGIANWFLRLPGMIWDALKGIGSMLFGLFRAAFDAAMHAIVAGWDTAYNWIKGIPGSISSALSSLFGTVSNLFHKAFDWIGGFVGGIVGNIGSAFGKIPGLISGFAGTIYNAAKGLGDKIFHGIIDGLRNAGEFVGSLADMLAHKIVNTMVDGLNALVPHKIHIHIPIPMAPDVNINVPLFPTIPYWNALGGIYDKPTHIGVGEAGREAVIPLTNPARAWEIVKQSGLLNVIQSFMGTTAVMSNYTPNKLPSGANQPFAGNSTIINNNTLVMNFHGNLEFPNIKKADEAEEFISKLEMLAGKR